MYINLHSITAVNENITMGKRASFNILNTSIYTNTIGKTCVICIDTVKLKVLVFLCFANISIQ